MTTKTLREVPVGMQRIYRRFERWRSLHPGGRKEDWRWAERHLMFRTACGGYTDVRTMAKAHTGRLPIPKPLWAAAAEVAREHGVFRTAKALSLEYGKLKRV